LGGEGGGGGGGVVVLGLTEPHGPVSKWVGCRFLDLLLAHFTWD